MLKLLPVDCCTNIDDNEDPKTRYPSYLVRAYAWLMDELYVQALEMPHPYNFNWDEKHSVYHVTCISIHHVTRAKSLK